jgi:hypothetical protein
LSFHPGTQQSVGEIVVERLVVDKLSQHLTSLLHVIQEFARVRRHKAPFESD